MHMSHVRTSNGHVRVGNLKYAWYALHFSMVSLNDSYALQEVKEQVIKNKTEAYSGEEETVHEGTIFSFPAPFTLV